MLTGLGVDPVGSYRLAEDPRDADRLVGLVLDGRGAPRCLVRTEDVQVAPLYTVDAAFAWEHGEGDRTRHSWLDAREDALRAQGVRDLEAELIVFERFSVVWPRPDTAHWWLPGVREASGHEALPDGPRPDLPALAAFDGDAVIGVLRFEPEREGLRLVTITTGSPRTEQLLREALALRAAAARSRR